MMPNALHNRRLPISSILIMASVLKEEGLDLEGALVAAGLSGAWLENPADFVTGFQEFAFQRCFAALTEGRPDLWVRTGQRYRILSYGIVGLALLTAPTFSDAIQPHAGWERLCFSAAKFDRVRQNSRIVGLQIDPTGVPDDIREFTIYRNIGAIFAYLQDLLKTPQNISGVELMFPSPGNDDLTRQLGCQISFNAERCAVYLSGEVGHVPLAFADSALHDFYVRQCDKQSAECDEDPFLARVRTLLSENLDIRLAADAALRLNVSKRTLQRRLARHNLSFSALVDDACADAAKQLLASPALPIGAIAFRMGFADESSFSRAFRRWTGLSPREFRNYKRGAAL